jgi:hypothetical protein
MYWLHCMTTFFMVEGSGSNCYFDAGFRLRLQDVLLHLIFTISNQSSSNILSNVAGSHTAFVLLSLSRL